MIDQEDIEQRKQKALDALDLLARMRTSLPEFDAVRVARESREELEQRSLDALREIHQTFAASGVSEEELQEEGRRVREKLVRERYGDS